MRFFSQPVPRWLLTTAPGAKSWQERRGKRFERILVTEVEERGGIIRSKSIDWIGAFEQLTKLGLKKLAILGGGELIASLLAVNLIDELWLTVCPLIVGGASAPTPVEGIGLSPQQAKKLELLTVERVGEEVFLHYRLQR